MPRLVASDNDSPATGAFSIEPTTGQVLWSELVLSTGNTPQARIKVVIRVTYGMDNTIKMWLPKTMDEEYLTGPAMTVVSIMGRAKYSNFRRFSVDATAVIK